MRAFVEDSALYLWSLVYIVESGFPNEMAENGPMTKEARRILQEVGSIFADLPTDELIIGHTNSEDPRRILKREEVD
jgi:hypothetical protein